MKKRRIIYRFFVCVLVVVMLIFLPSVKISSDDNLNQIYRAFLGTKSKYQGILEIWNIDTFESGKTSKSGVLNEIAKGFQKRNLGLYVLVRDLSEQECLNLILQGTFPDLFSCSFGVAEKLKDYVSEFENVNVSNVDLSAQTAGKVGEDLFGVAWCKSSYYLISTKERLEKTGKGDAGKVKLSDICLSLDYVKKNKKSEKQIYSMEVGSSKYLMPLNALKTYNKEGVKLISDKSLNAENLSQSSYSAYCNFIAENSSVLLGTIRDVFRMENRVKNGKVADVIYEQVTGFTDLIQFVMLSKNISQEKREYAEKFAEYLTAKDAQEIVYKSGLLSVIKSDDFANNKGIMQNITPQNFSDYATLSIFISENEIKKLQSFYW